MSGRWVRPPSGWDDFQEEARDRRERRDVQLDAMARRAAEGLAHERRVRAYRRRRAGAVAVPTVLLVAVWGSTALAREQAQVVTASVVTGVVLLVTLLLWHLVVGPRPRLQLTPLPDRATRHPAFEALDREVPPTE